MTQLISKTPLLILFILSVIPTLLINGNPQLWAFTNIVIFIFFSLWEYSIVARLVSKSKHEIKLTKFTRTLILTTIYICLLSTYFALTYENYDDPKWLLPIIIIGQFFLFFSAFYIIRFFARTIAIVELGRTTKFTDYFEYFVMIIFFPFGIWWLYPKIKSLIET
jgi:hypothetical protein